MDKIESANVSENTKKINVFGKRLKELRLQSRRLLAFSQLLNALEYQLHQGDDDRLSHAIKHIRAEKSELIRREAGQDYKEEFVVFTYNPNPETKNPPTSVNTGEDGGFTLKDLNVVSYDKVLEACGFSMKAVSEYMSQNHKNIFKHIIHERIDEYAVWDLSLSLKALDIKKEAEGLARELGQEIALQEYILTVKPYLADKPSLSTPSELFNKIGADEVDFLRALKSTQDAVYNFVKYFNHLTETICLIDDYKGGNPYNDQVHAPRNHRNQFLSHLMTL